ncbi:MAG: CBS domain-containing protein [Thermodesulfobacteriota bacterium]|jgi:tRNA nucleotidyltransferase (CCA-adding enzyme)
MESIPAATHSDTQKTAGIEVITTHLNTDFDGLASMMAAKKLYPEAWLVFPGSQEQNLRNFFLQSTVYLYNFTKIKQVPLERIYRLILVDTRQADRIGRFAEILNRPGLEIHIYDHHPSAKNDVRGSLEIIQPVGATMTLMTRLLKDKNIALTPDEATLMALGIYEDTGSFSFGSTTPEDHQAAAYLLEQGANLNLIADMLTRELTAEQVSLLNQLLESATRHRINNLEIVVTKASIDTYVGDFAVLAHKMMDMENLDCLFALARMEDRVYIVARSRIREINVGEILLAFGGGGHPSAASATVKDKTLVQVEETLILQLKSRINPQRKARDMMSFPIKSIQPQETLEHANELLTRYNINVLLVMEGEKLLGLITRQVIEKAIFHGLKELPVQEYMTTEFSTIEPEASLFQIQEFIIENKQRILPVVKQGKLLGVITRTDLLNILISGPSMTEYLYDSRKVPQLVRKKNVGYLMEERLPKRIIEMLKSLGEVADSLGYNAYAVGGFIRDLFLKFDNLDIDVVIEGDGINFAQEYAKRFPAHIRYHIKFKTAVLIFPDGFKVDVATARSEYYESPGALPVVERSSIKMDLYRRDFTINTLAVKLNPAHFGILIDFFGAQKDLKERSIRVLHNLSLVEDPTRAFRAVRFEQRFGFKIGKLTSNLIENTIRIGGIEKLAPKRIFTELQLILSEENPLPVIKRLIDLKLLQAIHPEWTLTPKESLLFGEIRTVLAWFDLLYLNEPYEKWLIYFLALTQPVARFSELRLRLGLPKRVFEIITLGRNEGEKVLMTLQKNPPLSRNEIYKVLSSFPNEVLLFLMAKTGQETGRKAISLYFTQLKSIRIAIGGEDLKTLGLVPGPIYKVILGDLLEARINGKVLTREDEIAYVKKHFVPLDKNQTNNS